MTPPTLTSLHLLRQQLSDAHADNMRKLDEAIANLSAPPPAPPAKTRGQEIAEKMVEPIANGLYLWDHERKSYIIIKGSSFVSVSPPAVRNCISKVIDAELARCEQEKQAALAAQQEQIAKWLDGKYGQYTRGYIAEMFRNGEWKSPTTE